MENIKKVLVLMLTLILIFSLAGCNTDSLKEYKMAAEKTEQVEKGQSSGEFTLTMDFNTEGMSLEEIKELNYYKDVEGSFNVTFDNNLEKGIYRNYLNLGGLGFDYDVYCNGDEIFMKIPIMGKYMRLNPVITSLDLKENNGKNEDIISEETVKTLSANWLSLMNKEDVFKGKNIVITTPDGEVKSTEYTIKLSDEQIKKLFNDSIDSVYKDENFKEFYKKIQKSIEPLEDKTLEGLYADVEECISNYKVENFSYIAYVDIDGYIVNEKIQLDLSVDSKDESSLVGLSYSLDINNWDFNKEQSFEFPILTDDNTVTTDDMDENDSFMIEDMFNHID